MNHGFVFRTDIKGYYQNMNLQAIYDYFTRYITCSSTLALLKQYLQVSVESGGEFFTPRGLCRGSALSPLIGAGLLFELDARMDALPGVFYVRYMDDMLIVAASRWSMRRARRTLLEMMDNMGFTLHPDKTQVGRLPDTSFDWLGWLFINGRVTAAPRAVANFKNNYRRRRIQLRGRGINPEQRRLALRGYAHRWRRWLALPVR